MDKLAGSNTGCFVGNFNYDHQLMQYRDAEYPQPYSVTGGGITVLSNRVNYISDLKGPSMTLDTACPSSMYALHMACTVVQTGECTAAVVGGSNLILTPECQLFSSMLGAVSPTFVCYTFDASGKCLCTDSDDELIFPKRTDMQELMKSAPCTSNVSLTLSKMAIRSELSFVALLLMRELECTTTSTFTADANPVEMGGLELSRILAQMGKKQ